MRKAGLELLTSLMRQLELVRAIRSEIKVKQIDYGYREEQHLLPLVLNIALRRTSFTDISWLAREEKLLKRCWGSASCPRKLLLSGPSNSTGDGGPRALKPEKSPV
ncbi:MAG TPA: hypothetical protein PLI53_00775 [Geobacteraceae bacterium]|nr:hypothetical protein [Geobacteraceae bacterium]